MRFLLLLSPLLLIIVLFALSNTSLVALTLWPTGLALEVPLSLAILAAMALAFVLGGLLVWFSALRQRRRARRAEHAVQLLEAQIAELRARMPPSPALPPAA